MKTSTLKSISIIAGAALGAALVGLLGTYLVLPEVAPDVAAETEAAADSTVNQASQPDTSRSPATADRSAGETGASETPETAPPETRDEDQAPSETAEPEESSASTEESSASTEEPSTSAEKSSASAETTRPDTTDAAVAQALRDSLQTLRRRLRQKKEEARTLQTETDSLRKKLAAADAEAVKVNKLSGALMDMRRRGLTNLLKEVNMSVLKKLYQQTTGTARTRLLQSMDPARAAQFVNQVVEDGTTEPSPISQVAPDSTLVSE